MHEMSKYTVWRRVRSENSIRLFCGSCRIHIFENTHNQKDFLIYAVLAFYISIRLVDRIHIYAFVAKVEAMCSEKQQLTNSPKLDTNCKIQEHFHMRTVPAHCPYTVLTGPCIDLLFCECKRMMMVFQWLNANSRCTWWATCIIKNYAKQQQLQRQYSIQNAIHLSAVYAWIFPFLVEANEWLPLFFYTNRQIHTKIAFKSIQISSIQQQQARGFMED